MPKRRAEELEEQENERVATPASKRSRRNYPDDQSTPSRSKKVPSKTTPHNQPHNALIADSAVQTSTPSNVHGTPSSTRRKAKAAFSTPTKHAEESGKDIYVTSNADRSARRKSTKRLIEQTVSGDLSDDDPGGDSLAQEIWEEENEERSEEDEEEEQRAEDVIPETPSKRGRGRPKGSKRKRTPTPPPNLPPHERFFFENRPTAAKSSSNTLSSADLISHTAYHDVISNYNDTHATSIDNLHRHHETSFPLWAFELSQQFSVCLHGYGSKRRLLTAFATYLQSLSPSRPPTIVILNGHHPSTSIRAVLNTFATTILPPSQNKLPTQPPALASYILSHLTAHPPQSPVYLILHPLYSKPLSTPASLSIISQLASHPSIYLLATADNPSFPLLFPSSLRSTFNFIFHDATTFLPYDTGTTDSELSTAVDSVLELLGRKTSAVQGREGVRWVLKSLPENARGLYRVLVSEILAAADADAPAFDTSADRGLDEEPELTNGEAAGRGRKHAATDGLPGVDAKLLYQKAVEEFLCSSEMMFWSLLKEFVDHRMVVVRRERGVGGGGEMLGVEMGREELEGVLEDLME